MLRCALVNTTWMTILKQVQTDTCVTAAGCGPVISIFIFMLTGDIHWSGYASGHYGDSVRDGYRILFYLGRARTHLTERWQALFSRYSQSCSCWAFGLLINLVWHKRGPVIGTGVLLTRSELLRFTMQKKTITQTIYLITVNQ